MKNAEDIPGSMDDLYSKPGHLIRRCQQIAVAIFLEETAEFGISSVQYAALVAIGHNPKIDATRLSQLIANDRSTVGNVLERLEQKKLIKRTYDTGDRRIKKLSLTPTGRQLVADIEASVERAQQRILAPLSAKDQLTFMEMLNRLVNINNAHSRAPGSAVAEA